MNERNNKRTDSTGRIPVLETSLIAQRRSPKKDKLFKEISLTGHHF